MMQQKIWLGLLSELEMQDIDHETDWKLAEIKLLICRTLVKGGTEMEMKRCEAFLGFVRTAGF